MGDLIQEKNRAIVWGIEDNSITAPDQDEYPDGGIRTADLPIALSWLTQYRINASADQATARWRVDVYVEKVGQSYWKEIKDRCSKIHAAFATVYAITNEDAYLTDNVSRITPGSVTLTGWENTINAPDAEPHHGFSLTFETTQNLDVTC